MPDQFVPWSRGLRTPPVTDLSQYKLAESDLTDAAQDIRSELVNEYGQGTVIEELQSQGFRAFLPTARVLGGVDQAFHLNLGRVPEVEEKVRIYTTMFPGMSPDAIRTNLKEFEEIGIYQKHRELLENQHKLAAWLADPQVMARAKNDIPAFSVLAGAMVSRHGGLPGQVANAAGNLKSSTLRGFAGTMRAFAEVLPDDHALVAPAIKFWDEAARAQGDLARPFTSDVKGFRRFALDTVPATVQIGVGAVLSALTKSPAPVMMMMGASEGGNLYQDLREQDVSQLRALLVSGSVGVVNGYIESLQVGKALEASGLESLGRGALREVFGNVLENIGQEAMQNVVNDIGRMAGESEVRDITLSQVGSRLAGSLKEGLYEGLTAGVATLFMATPRMTSLTAKYLQNREQFARMEVVNEILRTQFKGRDPETQKEAIDHMVGNQPASISAEAVDRYFQGNENLLDSMLTTLGVDKEAFQEAVAQGSEIQFSLGDWQTKVAPSEAGTDLFQFLRINPDSDTQEEAEQVKAQLANMALKLHSAISDLQNTEKPTPEQLQAFRTTLMEDGGFSAADADSVADLFRAGGQTFAPQRGESLDQWFARINPEIRFGVDYAQFRAGLDAAQFQDSDGVLYQDGQIVADENFRRWFGESKVLDEEGAPLRVYHGTRAGFNAFEQQPGSDFGFHFGSKEQATGRLKGTRGFRHVAGKGVADEQGERVIGAYLNIKNPLRVSDPGYFSAQDEDFANQLRAAGIPVDPSMSSAELKDALKEAGYDGLIYENEGGDEAAGTSYVALDSTQIKSVNNQGTFDPDNPNIFMQSVMSQSPEQVAGYETTTEELPQDIRKVVRNGEVQLTPVSSLPKGATSVKTAEDAANLLAAINDFGQERLMVVGATKRGKILGVVQHSTGTTNASLVQGAIATGSILSLEGVEKIYVAHNHPSGDPTQSDSDKKILETFQNLLRGTGVTLDGFMSIGAEEAEMADGRRVKLNPKQSKATIKILDRTGVRGVTPLTPVVVSSQQTLRAVGEAIGEGEGIVLLDQKNVPVGFVPMTAQEMGGGLRTEDNLKTLLTEIHATNASSIAGYVTSDVNPEVVTQNLKRFSNASLGTRLLDVVTESGYSAQEKSVAIHEGRTSFYQSEAYHGSPHNIMANMNPEDQRFNLKYMGTGEGAQAFGWGLYFTSEKGIAEYYAEVLSGRDIDPQVVGGRNLYKVTLWKGKDENLLDWSGAVTAEQVDAIAEGLARHPEADRLLVDLGIDEAPGSDRKQMFINAITKSSEGWGDVTVAESGDSLYGTLSSILGGDKAASLFLRDAGIDGIRFPAQSGGRGDGSKGWNYVVFDDAAVEIEQHVLYQRQGQGARGAIEFTDTKTLISIFPNGDKSTVIHELGHIFFREMQQLIETGQANPTLIASYNAMLKQFGKGGAIDEEGIEKAMTAWEAYFLRGVAPSVDMAPAFRTFRRWFTDIYRTAEKLIGKEDLDPDLVSAFNTWIATEQDMQEAEAFYGTAQAMSDSLEADEAARQERLEKARNRVKKEAQDTIDKEVEKRLRVWLKDIKGGRAEVRREVSAEVAALTIYKTLAAVKARGGLDARDILYRFDEKTLRTILAAHGKDVFARRRPRKVAYDPAMPHQEVLASGDESLLQAYVAHLEKAAQDLEKRNDKAVTRSRKDAAPYYRDADEAFPLSEDGIVYQIREAMPTGIIKENAANITQKDYNRAVDVADRLLADLERFDLQENTPSLVQAAFDLGTKAQAESSKRAWIQSYVESSLQRDYESASTVLEEQTAQAQEALEDLYLTDWSTEELLTDLPVQGEARNPVDLEEAAKIGAYGSAEELIVAMADAAPLQQAITTRTDEVIEAKRKEFSKLMQERRDLPAEAVHSDATLEFLLADMEVLANQLDAEKSRRVTKAQAKALKEQAYTILSGMNVRDAVRHDRWAQAESKHARQAFNYAEQGKWEEAYAAAEKRLYYFTMAQASLKIRENTQKIENRYKASKLKLDSMKIDNDYRVSIQQLLWHYRIRTATREQLQSHLLSIGVEVDPGLPRGELLQMLTKIEQEGTGQLELPQPKFAQGEEGLAQLLNLPEGVLPDWITNLERPDEYSNFKDLTVDELTSLDEVLQFLIDRGTGAFKAFKALGYTTAGEVINASVPLMEARPPVKVRDTRTKAAKLIGRGKRFLASLAKAEFMLEDADGNPLLQGEAKGVMHQIYDQIALADAKYENRKKDVVTQLQPALTTLAAASERIQAEANQQRIPVPEVIKLKRGILTWDADMVLSVALNSGNDANLHALQASDYQLGDDSISQLHGLLTAAEWDAIQQIWDTVNTLYTDLDAAFYSVYNKRVTKEQARSFTVRTQDGDTKLIKGGYWPLQFDGFIDDRAAAWQEQASILDELNARKIYGRTATPEKGMTISRLRDADGNPMSKRPPLLAVAPVLTRHLNKTVRFITHARTLYEADLVLSDPMWRDAFRTAFGREKYDELRQWLNHQANPSRQPTAYDFVFEPLRKLGVYSALPFRLTSGLKQRLSGYNAVNAGAEMSGLPVTTVSKYMLQAAHRIGVHGNLYGNVGKQIEAEVNAESPRMRARMEKIDRDINDLTEDFSPYKKGVLDKVRQKGQEWGFWWIYANDRAMTYPTYIGMRDMALQEKLNGITPEMSYEEAYKLAVDFAETVIFTTQPSALPSDLSGLQRSEGAMRLFSTFMTFRNLAWNRLSQHAGAVKAGKIGSKEFARHLAIEWWMPALTMLIPAALMYGDDDEPEWYNYMVDPAFDMAGTVPLVSEVTSALKYGQRDITPTSIEGPAKGIINPLQRTKKAISDPTRANVTKAMWSVYQAMEYWAGIPVSNLPADLLKKIDKIRAEEK